MIGTHEATALLVGYEDRDNLGLRYLISSARQAGFGAEMALYDSDPAPLLERVRRTRPTVIGFSLIFQYMAPDFKLVIDALRAEGVTAHITVGGHYPSFDAAEVLERIPGLDSVVRFEGEGTLVELLEKLDANQPWHGIKGLVYRGDGGQIVTNPLRPPVEDLDQLPEPMRDGLDYEEQALPTASILASRGCPWDCSFCSIRPFYEAQGGKLRRLRKPERVVEEMAELYQRRGVTCFLFQDDDYLAGGRRALEWAVQIGDGLIARGLAGKIAYKISCRSDEIDEATCRRLMASGLTHIYMGVESGDPDGLIHLSKRIKVDQHLRAGEILKKLGLSFDFGFMMLEPYSTLSSVRNNIDFLERFVGDGWSMATFCRTLPYAGTPLKAQLEREGRLLGTPFEPDYRFLDPKLDHLYEWILRTFHQRNFTNEGLGNVLKSLIFEAHLNLATHRQPSGVGHAYLHHLAAVGNRLACYTLRRALDHIEATPLDELQRDPGPLEALTRIEREEEDRLMREVADYSWWEHRSGGQRREPALSAAELPGAFENSWTSAPADLR
jgi:radical SAM superfamily enzyme YgiQ (UPF0313 family)